jgi:hypothetical protein
MRRHDLPEAASVCRTDARKIGVLCLEALLYLGI